VPRTATLLGAAENFANSLFVTAAFGKNVVSHYQAVAGFEGNEFLRSVTDWERERYRDVI
jgi:glutamine synthetase